MTQLLPGQLLYIFGVIFDAVLLSWLAMLWYRRSVNRLMRKVQPDAVAGSAKQQDSRFLPGLRCLRPSRAS